MTIWGYERYIQRFQKTGKQLQKSWLVLPKIQMKKYGPDIMEVKARRQNMEVLSRDEFWDEILSCLPQAWVVKLSNQILSITNGLQ